MTTVRVAHTLYVASGNPGKLRDFATAAAEFAHLRSAPESASAISIKPLPDLARIPAPAEEAETFEGNARAKALYYSLYAPGAVVIADDSGLEVDALGGAPGVYSARYAERAGEAPRSTVRTLDAGNLDTRNNENLLRELASVPTRSESLDHRGARYRCVLAAARDGMCVAIAEGSVEGAILLEPRGFGGFGYDPLFYLPSMQKTMAELDSATRLYLSHRGAALRALLPKLILHLS